LAQATGNSGVDVDYERVNPARKADFTSFVTVLADRLHQANKSLSITLPAPVKAGVTWDTGAYDWEQLARSADLIKLPGEPDPSAYYQKMQDVFNFLKPKVDLKKVALIVTRQSREKGNDGLSAMSLTDGLQKASEIDVRTNSSITPNSSVVIVGKNIFQDDGASGLRWDDQALAVSFAYPGRGGQRTVWLENSFSLTFRLDLVRRFGLGGVTVDDISANPAAPAVWDTLRLFGDTASVPLAQPNGVMLRPSWQIQAGSSEANAKGEVIWRAPAQAGAYDVSLIVSDGVIRAMQKITLNVGTAASPTPSVTATPRASTTPTTTVRP
jgi:spore germination protein YaaH